MSVDIGELVILVVGKKKNNLVEEFIYKSKENSTGRHYAIINSFQQVASSNDFLQNVKRNPQTLFIYKIKG